MEMVEQLRHDRRSRRDFLTVMTAAGLGFAADQLLSGKLVLAAEPAAASEPGVPTDGDSQFAAIPGANINIKVLNFALSLEILEADLYRQALNLASGLPLKTALNGNPNFYKRQVIGGNGLNSDQTDAGYLYLKQFTYVEAAHRDFLRAALGSAAIPANPTGYKFAPDTPPSNIYGILANILGLEENGVRAYLGALPYLTDLALAQVAGTIFSTEARHSAAIEYTLGNDPGPIRMAGYPDLLVTPKYPSNNTFEYYLQPRKIQQVAKFFNA